MDKVENKKSDGVKDVFKWLEQKCKDQKRRVDLATKEYEETKRGFYFDDESCIVSAAYVEMERQKAKLETLVVTKISVEKYMKRLKHESL